MKKHILFVSSLLFLSLNMNSQEDPFLWLEEVEGERALEFVHQQNELTEAKLSEFEDYQDIYARCLEIYNSSDKIVYPTTYGDHIYNFWKDKKHIRGIWRRSPNSDYLSGDPKWETLLDFDQLSEQEDVKWVYKGVSGLYPTYDRFLVSMSKGGGDAVEIREFDVNTKTFIEDGFFINESKGGASYIDKNTLVVYSDFGENTMTSSGYANQTRIWKRGSELENSEIIFEGSLDDVGTFGYTMRDGSLTYTMISRYFTSFTGNKLVWYQNKPVKLDIPDDSQVKGILNNQLIVSLKSDWKVKTEAFKKGTVISLNFSKLLGGEKDAKKIIEPNEFSSVTQVSVTKNKLLMNLLNNVTSELYIYSFDQNSWQAEKVAAPDFGTIYIRDVDQFSDAYFFQYENFVTPTTLYAADAGENTLSPYKSLTAYFDGEKYQVQQFKSKSKDGTLVPYFVVSSTEMENNGKNPTLIYAYGGFEVSELPFYSGTFGTSWLEKGGVFVLANIRGGGEFGPRWHQEGLKENRQNVFDDFYSVAEDLISRKITSSKNLGIMGGSNGGLLVGVAFTQRPELYEAVVCQVPLLDMKRYSKLLAGASWMGEYGDPDIPEEWEYIKKYSPYQNLKKDQAYPEVYFYTSTRDDRVHPGHARKMAAKMMQMGNKIFYYENTEGGHAGASTNEQSAKSSAMTFSYLLMKLK